MGDDAGDIIIGGPQTPPREWRTTGVAAAVLAVIVAASAGYLIGSRRTAPADPRTNGSPTSPPAVGPPALVVTGKQCWVQRGKQLQLGIEVVNESSSPVRLDRVEPDLPIGGLRLTTASWGACGQLSPGSTATAYPLEAGAHAWVTMTFDVADPCPAPYPVLFSVAYTAADVPAPAPLVGGFRDLGEVAYSGCPAPR